MKSLLWFVFGVVGGFVMAHLVDKDPRGHEVLAEIDSRINEFTDRMSDAYREQEAKFTGALAEVKDAGGQASVEAPTPSASSPESDAPSPESSAPSRESSAPSRESSAPSREASEDGGDGRSEGDVPTPKEVAEHTSVSDVSSLAGSDDTDVAADTAVAADTDVAADTAVAGGGSTEPAS